MDTNVIAKQLRDAQAFQTELLRKSRDHETLNSEGDALMQCTDRDQEGVREELEGVNQRWAGLNEAVSDRLHALEEAQNQLQEVGMWHFCVDICSIKC